ncbi:hypothetical protein, partial [Spirosoma daeguense]
RGVKAGGTCVFLSTRCAINPCGRWVNSQKVVLVRGLACDSQRVPKSGFLARWVASVDTRIDPVS